MRSILFDLGNVLVAYQHDVTIDALASCYGVGPEAVQTIFATVGMDFGLGLLTSADMLSTLNRHLDRALDAESFAQAFCAGLARDDDALGYALALQARPQIQVGAISNTNAIHVSWLDGHVPEIAEFELVMMSNEVHLLKPDPEIFELALELLNAAAGDVLYIDDLAGNVEAARQVGMAGIVHVNWGETRPQIEAWLAAA